jgi:hypothetical protein
MDSEQEGKRCVFCDRLIPNDHSYMTVHLDGQELCAHIGCHIKNVINNESELLDATDPVIEASPIVWSYNECVAGRMVGATIRRYAPNVFCWITLCDDGYLNSVRSSSVELSFDDARQAVEDHIMWYLLNC